MGHKDLTPPSNLTYFFSMNNQPNNVEALDLFQSHWQVLIAHPNESHMNEIPTDNNFQLYLTSQQRDRMHIMEARQQTVLTLRCGYYGRGTRNIPEGTIFHTGDDLVNHQYAPVVNHVFLKLLRNGQLVALWMVYVPIPPNMEDGQLDDASHQFHPNLVSLVQPSAYQLQTVFLREVRNTHDVEISGIRFVTHHNVQL